MIKYRIGIIGGENSHADSFAELFNMPDENGNYLYPDCRVTMVSGHYPEANNALAEKFNIAQVVDQPEEMLGKVDAVLITARDGKYHWAFAKPFLEAGIPMFVDKPFTADPKEAEALIALAKEKNVPLCGGSSIKYAKELLELKEFLNDPDLQIFGASLSAPVQLYSEHSGFYFYASHLAEITMELFGYNPKSFTAVKHSSSVCCMVHYEDFTVSNHFKEKSKPYTAAIYTPRKATYKEIGTDEIESRLCRDFVQMLRTGKMPYSYEKLLAPVYYMDAIIRSYETGQTVTL